VVVQRLQAEERWGELLASIGPLLSTVAEAPAGSATPSAAAQAHLAVARAALQLGQGQACLDTLGWLKPVLARLDDGDQAGVRQLRCHALLALGQVAAAEQALNELLDAHPDQPVEALRAAFETCGHLPRRWQRQAQAASEPGGPEPAGLTCFAPLPVGGAGRIGFGDVGGMQALKDAATMKIIQPMRRPALFRKYGQAAGGGLLLYGPPGCGKTWCARALAGECGAAFFNVGIHDILNLYVGNSERNVHQLFEAVRTHRPAILFIDEFDALGRKRELMRHSSLPSTINTFLAEMDGAGGRNDQLLVLAATNAPWDVDAAFRRPVRFDQTLFIPPPDLAARAAILDLHLAKRPCAGDVDTQALAQRTARFSGADLAALVQTATGAVLNQVLAGGAERPIAMADLRRALDATRPTVGEWLATARSHVDYANEGGQYD
jgi:AAA+ superfamily predicted ATPase